MLQQHSYLIHSSLASGKSVCSLLSILLQCQSEIFNLRAVPTIVNAHTFCASRDTRMGGVF